MAYGTPRAGRGRRGVLHRHPPGPAPDARAAGRPRRRYEAIGGLSPLAAAHRGPAGRPAAGARRASPAATRSCSAEARRADASRTPSGALAWAPGSTGSSVWCSPPTTRPSRSASTTSGREAAARGRPRLTRHRAAGTSSRPTSTSSPPRSPPSWPTCRPRRPGRCSPPTRSPSASSPAATPTPTQLRATADAVAARGRPGAVRRGASAASRPGAPPSRGSVPTYCTVIDEPGRGAESTACSSARCGFVADHLEVLYDLDIEARRHADGAGPRLRPHGLRERRPGGDGGAGRPGRRPASPRLDDVRDRRHVVVVGGGITGLAAAFELRRPSRTPAVTAARGVRPPRRQDPDHARSPACRASTPAPTCSWPGPRGGRAGPRPRPRRRPGGARQPARRRCGRGGGSTRSRPGLVLGATGLPARSPAPASCRGGARPAPPRAAPAPPPSGDDDLGPAVRRRFGDEVFDRLVGPLVGGINAADPVHLAWPP